VGRDLERVLEAVDQIEPGRRFPAEFLGGVVLGEGRLAEERGKRKRMKALYDCHLGHKWEARKELGGRG